MIQAAALNLAFGETGALVVQQQMHSLDSQFKSTRASAMGFYQETEDIWGEARRWDCHAADDDQRR